MGIEPAVFCEKEPLALAFFRHNKQDIPTYDVFICFGLIAPVFGIVSLVYIQRLESL